MAVGGDSLIQMGGFAPPMLLSMGSRLASRVPQNTINTVTTNVPGPQFPLYMLGHQMIEAYPFVPILGSVRISIAIFSYLGGLNFGVTGDYDSAPDLEVLCDGIEGGVREYLDIAGRMAGNDVMAVNGGSNGNASRTTSRRRRVVAKR